MPDPEPTILSPTTATIVAHLPPETARVIQALAEQHQCSISTALGVTVALATNNTVFLSVLQNMTLTVQVVNGVQKPALRNVPHRTWQWPTEAQRATTQTVHASLLEHYLALKAKGWTQEKIAKACYISRGGLHGIITGSRANVLTMHELIAVMKRLLDNEAAATIEGI